MKLIYYICAYIIIFLRPIMLYMSIMKKKNSYTQSDLKAAKEYLYGITVRTKAEFLFYKNVLENNSYTFFLRYDDQDNSWMLQYKGFLIYNFYNLESNWEIDDFMIRDDREYVACNDFEQIEIFFFEHELNGMPLSDLKQVVNRIGNEFIN